MGNLVKESLKRSLPTVSTLVKSPVGRSATSGFLARGINIAAGVVVLGALARYLDTSAFAAVAILTTLQGLLGYGDLGIGNGLINRVSRAAAREDITSLQRDYASGFFMLLAIASCAAVGVLVAGLAGGFIGLGNLVHLQLPRVVLPVALCVTLVGLPLSLGEKMLLAIRRQWLGNYMLSLASVGYAVTVLLEVQSRAPATIVVLTAVSSPLINGVLVTTAFWVTQPRMIPTWRNVSRGEMHSLLKDGGLFLILGVVSVLAYQTDVIVVSRYLAAVTVKEYVLAARVFGVASTLLALGLVPLWPVMSTCIAEGDFPRVRNLFLRSCATGLAISGAWTTFVLAAHGPIFHLLSGGGVHIAGSILVGFSLWTLFVGVNAPLSTLLNSMHLLSFQVTTALVMLVANLGLSVVLAMSGMQAGPITATFIAQVLFVGIPCYLLLKGDRFERLVVVGRVGRFERRVSTDR